MKYKSIYLILILFLVSIYFHNELKLLLNFLNYDFGIYSALIIGFFYSYSFTSPISASIMSNVEGGEFVFSLLAATGSMLADLTILRFFRGNLHKEIRSLLNLIQKVKFVKILKNKSSEKVKAFIGFGIIGSPLPDEIGILIMENNWLITSKNFLLFSFIANFSFILIITKYL